MKIAEIRQRIEEIAAEARRTGYCLNWRLEKMRRCEYCNNFFANKKIDARFCYDKCRWTFHNRANGHTPKIEAVEISG